MRVLAQLGKGVGCCSAIGKGVSSKGACFAGSRHKAIHLAGEMWGERELAMKASALAIRAHALPSGPCIHQLAGRVRVEGASFDEL